MKFLMFVCGPNGSGKSSFTRGLGIQRDVPVLDPDLFSSQGVSDLGAGKLAIRQPREYMASGVSFIRESTLSSRLDLRLMEQARGRAI